MRRRALLAASAASGGGGGNESFYAEFYFDYIESDVFGNISGYRAPDELSLRCYTRAMDLINKYGVRDPAIGYSILSNPINYGFSVYIEQELCTELVCYDYAPSAINITTNGDYGCLMNSDGEIYV